MAGLDLDPQSMRELEAATFRRLLAHLGAHPEVQNIELMSLAGFCRNCLSKWFVAEAESRGLTLDYEAAREMVYGMPYADWKALHQQEATPEQLEKFRQHQAESHSSD